MISLGKRFALFECISVKNSFDEV